MSATTQLDLTTTELEAISRYLVSHGLDVDGPLGFTLIAGGRSNLTYRLQDNASQWVLRMPPRVGRTPSAHNVAREFRVIEALTNSEVPVARPVALCQDASVIGSDFAVTEFVPGRTVQSREDLNSLDDPTVASVSRLLIETLAALHQIDHVAVGLAGFGRPDGFVERQIRRWSGQWELVAADDASIRREAAALIRQLIAATPPQRAVGIVHGDFRIDNTLLCFSPPRAAISAVVDWELSTIGDPVADLAMTCAYRNPAFDLIIGAPTAWTSDRLPAADGLAAAYEAAGGAPITSWRFHLALAYFKIAVIAAGIGHRHRLGATSGSGFETAAQSVPEFLAVSHDALLGI